MVLMSEICVSDKFASYSEVTIVAAKVPLFRIAFPFIVLQSILFLFFDIACKFTLKFWSSSLLTPVFKTKLLKGDFMEVRELFFY